MHKRSFIAGFAAADALLVLFIVLVTGISGWVTTKSQFEQYWYYLVPLAIGFGIQVGMYVYLREAVERMMSKKVMAITGSTSTVAMISCCAHYLVNILPIVGATGVATFIGQYQVRLFWVGIAFNLFGIAFIARKVMHARAHLNGTRTLPNPVPPSEKPLINNAVVVATFAIVVAAVSFLSGRMGQPVKSAAAQGGTTAVSPSDGLTKTNSENGMTVSVTPKRNTDGSWGFLVAIDNHSVSVTQDMVEASLLTDANGKTVKPTSWAGDPPGGHHRKGTLTFGALSSPPVSVTIRDLGGVPERTFTWDNLTS